MARVLIGRGITNAQGIAVMTEDAEGNTIEGYTGVGAGKVDITAVCGGIQSETYEILDCVFMDYKSNGEKNTNWVKNNSATVTTDDTTCETTVTASSGTGTYRATTQLTGDFETILEAETNGEVVRVGFTDNVSKYRRIQFNSTDYMYIKFSRVSSTWTAQTSTDGETWSTVSNWDAQALTDENCYFIFQVIVPSGSTGSRSITYKNLKIYPI